MWIEAEYEYLNKNEINTTTTDTVDNLSQMNKEIPQTKEETTNVGRFSNRRIIQRCFFTRDRRQEFLKENCR